MEEMLCSSLPGMIIIPLHHQEMPLIQGPRDAFDVNSPRGIKSRREK
jgi:hypothetical protein